MAKREGILRRIVAFGRALRRAGLPVAPDQVRRFAGCLDWIDPLSKRQFYLAARSTLIYRREDLPLFDQVFESFWGWAGSRRRGPRRAPRAPRHEPAPRPRPALASLMGGKASSADPELDAADLRNAFSPVEVLQRKDFAKMTPEELEQARRLMARTRWRAAMRRTRRRVRDRRGGLVDVRRALREAARHAGKVARIPRASRKVKPRPLVLIADISGSMDLYSRLLLRFFHAVNQAFPDVESFVFGTRLSRVTPQLRIRDIERALAEVSLQVVDWSGGTRIGDSLREFNRRWARRVLRRGAVVALASDGCERGDTGLLERELGHLQRRCRRLIWLNPRLGHPDYQPLAEGMAAALPIVDDFLPVHNLQSLEDLAEHLENLPRGNSPSGMRLTGRGLSSRFPAPDSRLPSQKGAERDSRGI